MRVQISSGQGPAECELAVAMLYEELRKEAVEMKQEIGDSEYVTWIYWDDGSIRELFTDTSSGLGLADGLEILECQGLKFSKDGRLLRIETVGEGGGSLELSLRSGGLETDE